MRTPQGKAGFVVPHESVGRGFVSLVGVAPGAVVPELCKFTLMMIRMTVRASFVSHLQHHFARNLEIGLVALVAFHVEVFPVQSEIRHVMIELPFTHILPAGRDVA